jgi:large subunit ribosomal protein L30
MIAIIRISGMIGLKRGMKETLDRLRLRRKFSCVIIPEENKELMGMVIKVKDHVAFGNIDDKTLKELIKARAKPIGEEKISPEKILEGLKSGKKLKELGVKSFFRLHPPRGGIKTKEHFPKGVRGNNKEAINKLIGRML